MKRPADYTSKQTRLIVAIGVGVLVLTGLAIAANPIFGIGVLLLIIVVFWIVRRPQNFALVLIFLTVAFPKAGIKVGTFPFPVFLFGLLVALVCLGASTGWRRIDMRLLSAAVAVVLWSVLRIIFLAPTSDTGSLAALAAWFVLPVVVALLASALREKQPKVLVAVFGGFIVAALYGLLQLIAGIEAVSVPGLTIAYGDDYANKNNVIFGSAGDFSKIPSTYQNGNIFGVTAAVLLTLSLLRLSQRTAGRLELLVMAGSALAIGLSGSRTGLLVAVLGCLLVFLKRGHLGRKLFALAVVFGGVALTFALQPGLRERYSLDNVSESGGAGRSEIWADAINGWSPVDIAFGTANYISHEGWAGVIDQVGAVGVVLLLLVGWLLAGRNRPLGVVLLVVAFAAVIDSSYQLFPTWFIPAILIAAPLGKAERAAERVASASAPVQVHAHALGSIRDHQGRAPMGERGA